MSTKKSTSAFFLALTLIPIFVLGGFLRFYNIDKTALEVDEPVNFAVAKSFVLYGYPSVKPVLDALRQPYLFHPLFGYQLTAEWFEQTNGITVIRARFLNAVASLIVLLLVFLFVLKKGKGTALLATFFIALDGWVITINRMDYLENFQLILIIIGIWLFSSAVKNGDNKLYRWVLAGIVLGFAFIFKHIGIFLVLVVLANWLLTRKYTKGYVVALITMEVVAAIYVSVMYFSFGLLYLQAQVVEFARLFGITSARGLNFGLSEVISVIADRYWIYITTVIAIVLGWPLAAWRYIQSLIKRTATAYDTVVISWAVGAAVFAVASQLKSPHYMVLWLIPLYVFLAGEVGHWFRGKRLANVWILVIFFLAASIFTWNIRFMVSYDDSLRDSANYINTNLPPNAVIGTESYLAELFNQQYTAIEQLNTIDKVEKNDYLAIYTSSTASISSLSPIIQDWQQYCWPLQTFTGFKDQVTLCKVNHYVLARLP